MWAHNALPLRKSQPIFRPANHKRVMDVMSHTPLTVLWPPVWDCLTVRPLCTGACPADQSQSTCLLAHIKAGQTSATHCFCLARPASGMSLHTKPGGLISIWRCHLSRSNRNLYTARHWLIGSDIIFQPRQGLVRLFPYRGNSPSP